MVIVVIAILAAVTTVAYNGIRDRAAESRRQTDMTTLLKAIQIARESTGRSLGSITGSYWSLGACSPSSGNPGGLEPRTLPTTHTCWQRYYAILANVGAASGIDLSGLRSGDSRGNPYIFDENEGEGGDTCRTDSAIMYYNGNGASISTGIPIPKFFPSC